MNDERDDEVFERRMAAALREERGERVPDVTAAVLARVAAGEVVAMGTAAPVRSRVAWLAAAAVFLLGIATVFAVAWSQRGGGGDANGGGGDSKEAQQPEQPKLLEVTRIGDITALPRDLKAVELRNLEDDAVAALVARCPDLEHLRMHATTAGKRQDDLPAQSITDAALPAIGKLTKLRRLELDGTVLVSGRGLHQLEGLPLLESLTLRFFDVDDDALQTLPKLPSLRELDLSHNQVIGSRGLDAIGKCVGLRRLNLATIPGQAAGAFAPLGKLTLLESLDLHGINHFHRGVADEATQKRFAMPPPPTPIPDGGIKADMLQAWPRLHTLSLAWSNSLEADFGAVLAERCPNLRDLDIAFCANVDDSTIARLTQMPKLTRLAVANCDQITEAGIRSLAAAKVLQIVDFGTWSWLEDNSKFLKIDQAEVLLRAGKRVDWSPPLDRRQAFERLKEVHAEVYGRFRARTVRSLAELEALPKDSAWIELRNLGDQAAERLAQFPDLRRVAVVRDDDDPFTVRGMKAVAGLPKLERIELNNLPRLESYALLCLATAQALHTIEITGCTVDLPALGAVTSRPMLRDLSLVGVRTFGVDGAEAIGKCKRLQCLDLSGCDQLVPDAIRELNTLNNLVTLNLRNLPNLSDSALKGLQHLEKLRELRIGPGCFTSSGMQALAGMRDLKVLQVSGNVNLDTSALLHLPVDLEDLQLDECPGIGDDAGTLLRDRFPALRSLDLGGNAKITDAALAAILQNPSLLRLGIRDCSSLTTASFAAIRDARNLRELDATRAPCLTDATAAELQRLRPELKVTRKVW